MSEIKRHAIKIPKDSAIVGDEDSHQFDAISYIDRFPLWKESDQGKEYFKALEDAYNSVPLIQLKK